MAEPPAKNTKKIQKKCKTTLFTWLMDVFKTKKKTLRDL